MTEQTARLLFGDEGVLLHELNHRINNEFAAAISVVSDAAARAIPSGESRPEWRERVAPSLHRCPSRPADA
jgi:hypothetical protein